MIARFVALGAFAWAASLAPVQCAHEPDPNLRREDTAGDALWNIAQKFKTEHNDAAAKETLEYLVSTYPSNRHVGEAKEELAKLGGAPAASAVATGADGG